MSTLSLKDNYDKRRLWADQFLPQQKAILGQLLLREPIDEHLDNESSVDVMTSRDGVGRVGFSVSLRILEDRKGYAEKYGQSFTLRAHSRGPHLCETQRCIMQSGGADLLLFCWAERTSEAVTLWRLIDLQSFKQKAIAHLMRNCTREEWSTYEFDVYDLKKMDGLRIVRTKGNQFIAVDAAPYQLAASDDGDWILKNGKNWSLKNEREH